MAKLEDCPTCGNQTSENASTCPACGEPFVEGWADVIKAEKIEAERVKREKAEEEKQQHLKIEKTKEKAKRKFYLIATCVLVLFIAGFAAPDLYNDYYEENLKTVDPAEFNKRIGEIEERVEKIPASDISENIRLYKELQAIDPDNARYRNKITHYQNEQKKPDARAAKMQAAQAEKRAAEAKAKAAKIIEKAAKDAARKKTRLLKLRKSNPDAYLAEIKTNNNYISELKILRPRTYRKVIAKQKETARQVLMASNDLELIKWSWGTRYGYATAEGLVKNISGRSLKNVTAVIIFNGTSGNFIKSSHSLIEFNPVLSGQSSPFKVSTSKNPAMSNASISFKRLLGGTLTHFQSE